MARQSAQLAQCAACRVLSALARPRPPNVSGNEASCCASTSAPRTSKMVCKHCHTFLSCDTANGNVNSGDTIRSQKFARVDAYIHSNNQPACGSFTSGMRWKRTCCSSDFLLKNSCTYCGCPIGAPKTFSPCLAAGNSWAPLQTTCTG